MNHLGFVRTFLPCPAQPYPTLPILLKPLVGGNRHYFLLEGCAFGGALDLLHCLPPAAWRLLAGLAWLNWLGLIGLALLALLAWLGLMYHDFVGFPNNLQVLSDQVAS